MHCNDLYVEKMPFAIDSMELVMNRTFVGDMGDI